MMTEMTKRKIGRAVEEMGVGLTTATTAWRGFLSTSTGSPDPRCPLSQLIDVHQVAHALHLSVRAIYSRVNRGFFPDSVLVKLGEGTLRFHAQKLEDFLMALADKNDKKGKK